MVGDMGIDADRRVVDSEGKKSGSRWLHRGALSAWVKSLRKPLNQSMIEVKEPILRLMQ